MKIIAVLTYLAFSQVLAAELVLKDDFVDPSGMDLQPDLNINVPERQSGTRPTTYSAEVPPTGEVQIGIESKAPLFEDDTSVLLMRTGPRAAEEAVFTAVDLNEDFAPELSGKKWKL